MVGISSLKGQPLLNWDSVARIRVKGLSKYNSGEDCELVIPRAACLTPVREECIALESVDTGKQLCPPKPTFPPSGGLELELRLGDLISLTLKELAHPLEDLILRHTIYKVNVLSFDGKTPDAYIPPLVLKVARWEQHNCGEQARAIATEGGMYDHLKHLQGVFIPRCYGYFQTLVDRTQMTILPWDINCVYPRNEAEFDIFYMPNAHACLSVLLLEQVGEPITKGMSEDEIKQDLDLISKELSDLGIVYEDWRIPNILKAPQVPPGLPGLVLQRPEYPNHVYKLRLIDFEHAEWTNWAAESIMEQHGVKCAELIAHMFYL